MIKELKTMWEDITEENYPETQEEQNRTLISYVINNRERVYLSFNECRLGWGVLLKDSDLQAKVYKVPKIKDNKEDYNNEEKDD